MVKFTTTLNDRKFFLFLLKQYSVQKTSLTQQEAELASYILTSDHYPFSGRGRRKITKQMGITSANFSMLLGRLVKKGVFIKSDSHNDYGYSQYFDFFKKKWEENDEIQIGYVIKKQKNESI